jgi:DNA-binding NarL/FixJ family response regulator
MPLDARRVLVVEDEPLMSSLLTEVLTDHGFAVHTAADVAEARREIDAFDPDMLLLDVSLGEGPTGIHLAHALRMSRPDIAILIFTSQAEAIDHAGGGLVLPPGVGYLRKHQVNDGEYLIDAMEKVLSEQVDVVNDQHDVSDVFAFLGPNGSRTLRLLAEGFDNDEIARRCGVSRKTIERWIEQVYRDLGIDTKGSLNPRVAAARRFFFAVGVPGAKE